MSTTVNADLKDATITPTTARSSVETVDKKDPIVDTTSVASNDLLDAEPEPFKLSNWLFKRHLYKTTDLNSTATRRSVYDDPYLAEHYWPKSNYENIHRFDPKVRWTHREEKVYRPPQFQNTPLIQI
jgi:hypothetical protein